MKIVQAIRTLLFYAVFIGQTASVPLRCSGDELG
jgi:hypothetical protein